jgi:putative membrane protein
VRGESGLAVDNFTFPTTVACQEAEMSTPAGEKPSAELRDYLAEERTFLAWIRTGLTLMGFGFVVARFGIFLEVMQITRANASVPHSYGFSRWIGTMFVVLGVVVNVLSTQRHVRLVGELNRGQVTSRGPSLQGVVLALFLALVGVAMALYVSLA